MKLSELHDLIKTHPYRLSNNEQYKKSYRDLLYKISEEFYQAIKNHPKYSGAKNMIHDFNGAISNFRVDHIEKCLGVIHTFIDTGQIPYFYTDYGGVNILKADYRNHKYVYHPDLKEYVVEYTKEQLFGMMKEQEQYWRDHPQITKYQLQYSIYSHELHDYFLSLYEKGLYK